MFSLCVKHTVSSEPEWIPCSENQLANFISHIQDWDDWQLNLSVFYSLQIRWGPCTVDHFASYYNTQLPRFNSCYYNPGAEVVDAFTCVFMTYLFTHIVYACHYYAISYIFRYWSAVPRCHSYVIWTGFYLQ